MRLPSRKFQAVACATAFFLAACAAPRLAPKRAEPAAPAASENDIRFQIIYVIHGDANYTYHDSTGRRHTGDLEALSQAREVAENTSHSEVFIFYQKHQTHLFGSNADGMFYHYRGGRIFHEEPYSRAEAETGNLETEARLYLQGPAAPKPLTRFFVYFGHEIPMASQAAFSQGLARFTPADSAAARPFALAVLSVCYGGNPALLARLSPLTNYILASPAYLHLSFLDTRGFRQLDSARVFPLDREETSGLARNMAAQSFQRLRNNTQTEISVALYDMKKAYTFPKLFTAAKEWKTASSGYHDCAMDPGFDFAFASAGVEVYYQPPKFGPSKDKPNHSGWECPGSMATASGNN